MHRRARFVAAMGAMVLVAGIMASGAGADTLGPEGFEGFALGNPNGQFGWTKTGGYDVEVVSNTYGYASFGGQSLRISNALTSGSFGDHTFSASLTDDAGESTADSNGLSGGARQPHFEAQWDFASTVPGSEQAGLSVVASPDRGDGARMSWIQMADTSTGLKVNFFDYRDKHVVGTTPNLFATGCDNAGASNPASGDGFFSTTIASGLDRGVVHTIKVTMDFLEGPRNDAVRVWVDGALVHTDTSWEDYFRYCEATDTSRTVDSILFRTGGVAVPANLGNGFLIDNFSLSSGPIPPTDSDGEWTLSPEQSVSSTTTTTTETLYQARVRPPINADGSSNFPKRRGVIPVQFNLESATRTLVETTTTVGPVVFQSIWSDNPGNTANDYSFLRFVPNTPMLFADLNELVADYSFTQGNCGGGTLAWYIRVDVGNDGNTSNDKSVFLYFGDVPSFTDCAGAASNSGQNLIGSSDARFDLSQVGGPWYGTYADALAIMGGTNVLRASLVLDGGWANGDQVVDLTGASADGNSWEPLPEGETTTVDSDTTTPFAGTCDLPQAELRWSKNDPVPSGAVNEAQSIQPGDSGDYYRIVDCKYIYNLDVSSLDPDLSTRAGTYRVWVHLGGQNIPDPAKFDLRG